MTRRTRFALLATTVVPMVILALPLSAFAGNDGVMPAHDQPKGFRPEARIEEHIGAQVPMDLVFRDENDQAINLGDAIGGKPTILVPVYYRCPMLCTKVLTGVLEACRQMPADFSVGGRFNIVTVSMDPLEHGDLARTKKKNYLAEYGRPGAENGWRFLTGKKENIATLLDSVGYKFEFDKMLKEYNHPSGIIILSPQGKITRYFYGIGYDGEFELDVPATDSKGKITRPTTTLRLSLIEANEGKSGSLLEKLTLLCYRYDHLKQGYAFNILMAVRIGGIITLSAVVVGMFIGFRREWRKNAATRDAAITQSPHDDGVGGTA